jgi:hypothetical protein
MTGLDAAWQSFVAAQAHPRRPAGGARRPISHARGLLNVELLREPNHHQSNSPTNLVQMASRHTPAGRGALREMKLPSNGPSLAGAGRALGASCAWLWSCGGTGRLLVRRSLWRRQHSDDYRGGTALTVRPEAPTPGSAIRALPDLCFGIVSERLVRSTRHSP